MHFHSRSARPLVTLLLLCLASAGSAIAQVRPATPSTAQPGSIERQEEPPRLPEPPSSTPPVGASIESQAPPPNADALTFTLASLEIDGTRALKATDLLHPYLDLVGKTISVAKVYSIAAALTARYHNAGYILSLVIVPPQSITGGQVKLRAVEGYLANIKVEGDVGHRRGLLDKMRATVLADRPLRNKTLERYMLLLNDLPGVTAQSILQPSAAVPGASDLTVRLVSAKVTGSLSGSNRGSRLQGPKQYQAVAGVDSLFGAFDNTTLQYLKASRSSELQFGSFSHSERLTASGLELTASGSWSRANPALGESLALLNLQTNTDQGRIELDMPIERTRASSVYLKGAFTYNDSKTETTAGLATQDKLAALRVGLSWDGTDRAFGVDLADFEFSKGFSGLGTSAYGDPLASRPGGRPDFSKATLNLARLQSLGGPFSLLLAVNGQLAFTDLLLPEEYGFGGEYFGRAYDPSELVGDSGLAGKVEVRYTLETAVGFGATVYAFADRGEVWHRDATQTGGSASAAATSDGGGLRVTFARWLSGYLEAAKPVDHIVAAEGNEHTRVFCGLQANFVF